MSERGEPRPDPRAFFDELWRQGDYWQLETSEFDQRRYDFEIELLADRRYARALEIGCGAGAFTIRLAALADPIVALDVSEAAIDRARELHGALPNVEFRVADVMKFDFAAEGPWDLVVMSETIYYLGWLYPFFDVAWLAIEVFGATAPEGRFLMGNTVMDYELLDPRIVRTYRDLFLNVGFELEREETLRAEKDEAELDALVLLYRKPPEPASTRRSRQS